MQQKYLLDEYINVEQLMCSEWEEKRNEKSD